MKRFLITNPRFDGEAVLLYNEAGLLVKIDCTQTNMDAATMKHFKAAAPVQVMNLKEAFSNETVVAESSIEITFEQFWQKYDHKFNRLRCENLWQRMSKSDKLKAYFELDKYNRYLQRHEGQAKLHPDTYLRSKAWLNDYK